MRPFIPADFKHIAKSDAPTTIINVFAKTTQSIIIRNHDNDENIKISPLLHSCICIYGKIRKYLTFSRI